MDSVNEHLRNELILYHARLVAVENSLIKIILRILNPAVQNVFLYLSNERNDLILERINSARVIPYAEVTILDGKGYGSVVDIVEASKKKKNSVYPAQVKSLAKELRGQIDDRMNGPLSQVMSLIKGSIVDMAAQAAVVHSIIISALPASVRSTLGLSPSDSPVPFDILVRWLASDEVGVRYRSAVERRYKTVMSQIEGILADGLVEGKPVKVISSSVRAVMSNSLRKGIALIARTEIQNASNEINKRVYSANSDLIKGEYWLATLDIKTCLQCGNLDGRKFKLGEGPIPIKNTHPICRCKRLPILKSWKELGVDIKDVPAGSRASMDGAVPATTTYADWFDKQSSDRQYDILGRTRYELYKSGKLKYTDMASISRTYTLKQLSKKYGIDMD